MNQFWTLIQQVHTPWLKWIGWLVFLNGQKPPATKVFSHFLSTREPKLVQRDPKVNQFSIHVLTQQMCTPSLKWKEWLLLQIMDKNPTLMSLSMNKPTTWCKSGQVSSVSSSCLYKTQPEGALAQVCHTRIDALSPDEYQFHLLLHRNSHHSQAAYPKSLNH